MYRVVLAEDHRIVRDGLRLLLERAGFSVVGEASDGEIATHLVEFHRPDVLLLDLFMPVHNGFECAEAVLARVPRTRIVVLTVHDDERDVVRLLRMGVGAYLLKREASFMLIRAITQVLDGGLFLSPHFSKLLLDSYLGQSSALTDREQEVLRLVVNGQTSREVAEQLGVKQKTIETYRARLMNKLDVHDTAGLVRYALRRGVVEL